MDYATTQTSVSNISEQSDISVRDDLIDLGDNPKFKYSAMIHRMVLGKSHKDIIEFLHLPVDKDAELNTLMKADYISDDDKLQINAALLNFPYLHDTTHCSLEKDLYGNVVLFELMEENTLALVQINGAISLLIGSQKGLEYVTDNKTNKQCPINQYFQFHNVVPKYFTAMGKHVKAMLVAPNEESGNKIFDLSNQGALRAFFEKAVMVEMLSFSVRINGRTNKVDSIQTLHPNKSPIALLDELIKDDILAYTFNTMTQVSLSATDQGQPMVYLSARQCIGIAYKASRIVLSNQSLVLEFELFPLIEDEIEPSLEKLSEANITRMLNCVDNAMNNREPLIICTPNKFPSKMVHITILRHIIKIQQPLGTFVCNYKQSMYHGHKLLSIELESHNINDILNLASPFVVAGEIKTREQVDYITTLYENLVPFIALTSSSPKSVPALLQKHVVQLS